MMCDATFTRGGLTLCCNRQAHPSEADGGGLHYDFHLDAEWCESLTFSRVEERFVPSISIDMHRPEAADEAGF